MKYITFIVPNGDKYGLPLELVAKKRAEHYADEGDTDGEIKYVMEDLYEGIDWYLNNQNPEDFKAEDFRLIAKAKTPAFFEMIGNGSEYTIEEIGE